MTKVGDYAFPCWDGSPSHPNSATRSYRYGIVTRVNKDGSIWLKSSTVPNFTMKCKSWIVKRNIQIV